MPWQRHVLDVALEVDPDTGLLAYREVTLTVPRQSGKTTLLLCAMVHRALGFGGPQRIVYTAQTRNDARRKWEDEHVRLLENSQLSSLMDPRRQYGAEAIRWTNGSHHGITASTEKAGHGEILDLAVIDEAFAQVDGRLEQGLSPTMITRPQPQLWVVSTAGTRQSAYLRGKVDTGRARAELELSESAAYFEWSAPDDATPGDPETWRACMPALGHTVAEKTIRDEYQRMNQAEFRRAYLNQWSDDISDDWTVIPERTWRDLADPRSEPVDPVAFALDVAPGSTSGAVAVAGRTRDGNLHVEVVEHKSGTSWMVDRVLELDRRWKHCAFVLDPAGPAGSLVADLDRAGLDPVKTSARDAAQAFGWFYNAVTDTGTLRHLDQGELNAAIAGSATRKLGDALAWDRLSVSVDISPLVAVTLAAWGHATYAHQRKRAKPWAMYV